jgi:hypothetical protein
LPGRRIWIKQFRGPVNKSVIYEKVRNILLTGADRIKQARDEAAEFVESKVRELKNSPEGRELPIDWLRANLRATNRTGSCDCKLALALLGPKHDR